MADLLVTIGTDSTQLLNGLREAGQTTESTANRMAVAIAGVEESFRTSIRQINGNLRLFGESTQLTNQRISAIETAINGLLRNGVRPADERIQALTRTLANLRGNGTQPAAQALNALTQSSNRGAQSLTDLGRIVQDAPFGFIAIQNNISPLIESFGRLQRETGSIRGALSSLLGSLAGPAGIGIAVSLATSALTLFFQAQQRSASAAKEQKKANDELSASVSKDTVALSTLYEASQNLNLSHSERLAAVNQLQQQYPAYFKNLSDEAILAGKAASAYDNLTQSILNRAVVSAGQAKIEELSKPLVELILQEKTAQAAYDKANKEFFKKYGKPKPISRTLGFVDDTDPNLQGNNQKKVLGVFDVNFGGKTKADMESVDEYKKKITDKIKEAKAGLQQVLEDFGINALIDPNKAKPDKTKKDKEPKTQLELLEAQLKSLQDAEAKYIDGGGIADFFNPTDLERNINAMIIKIEDLKKALAGAVTQPTTGALTGKDINIDTSLKTLPTSEDMQNAIVGMTKFNELKSNSISATKAYNKELATEKNITQGIAEVVGGGLVNAFQSALSGGKSFIAALGDFLLQLVEKLLAAAAAAAILAAILSYTSFGTSAATGAAGAASTAATFGSLFSKFSGLKLADGGITTGPSLAMIGEGREKEAIIPLSKLDQFVNNNKGGGSFTVEHKVQGSDLLLVINRAQKTQSRKS